MVRECMCRLCVFVWNVFPSLEIVTLLVFIFLIFLTEPSPFLVFFLTIMSRHYCVALNVWVIISRLKLYEWSRNTSYLESFCCICYSFAISLSTTIIVLGFAFSYRSLLLLCILRLFFVSYRIKFACLNIHGLFFHYSCILRVYPSFACSSRVKSLFISLLTRVICLGWDEPMWLVSCSLFAH